MVRLIQYLCPQRQCIAAAPYDPSRTSAENALCKMKAMLAKLPINPWCGICGSRSLHYEDMVTIFKTMDEAFPVLMAEQQRQIHVRRIAKAEMN